MTHTPIRILMVCLGNICRSPSAEAVLRHQAEQAGLGDSLVVDSAGTSDWHIGAAPDQRSTAHAAQRGYVLEHLQGRQVSMEDFEQFDLILAMDKSNLSDLRALCPEPLQHRLRLFLSFGQGPLEEVPDPYHGGADGFEEVLDLIEDACAGLLDYLAEETRQRNTAWNS